MLPDRLAGVLAVVYLVFNHGCTDRGDPAAEAIRPGRLVAEVDEPEVHAARTELLRRLGRREEARAAFRARPAAPSAGMSASLGRRRSGCTRTPLPDGPPHPPGAKDG